MRSHKQVLKRAQFRKQAITEIRSNITQAERITKALGTRRDVVDREQFFNQVPDYASRFVDKRIASRHSGDAVDLLNARGEHVSAAH